MIAEPYICIKGERAGQIEWFGYLHGCMKAQGIEWMKVNVDARRLCDECGLSWATYHRILHTTDNCDWVFYTDFEREKLKKVCAHLIISWEDPVGYVLEAWLNVTSYIKRRTAADGIDYHTHSSKYTIHWDYMDYMRANESTRVLKRSEFLKAVCEEQGVEWLPSSCDAPKGSVCLTCAAHRAEEERVDDLLKEAARKHGVPRSYFGEPPSHDVFPVYNQVEPHTLEDDLGTSHDVVKELCKKGTLYVGQDEEHLKEVGPIRNIHIEVCPKMPDDEAVFYDKETGDAVRLKNIGRDYYTKEEVDERVRGVVDLLSVPGTPGDLAGWYDDLKSYRSRFLS